MSDRDELENKPIDKIAFALRAGGSFVPVGGFWAEVITNFIPNLRADRIVTFLKRLDDRVELLEEKEAKLVNKRRTDPEYIALFEDGAFHAAKSPSEDRIKNIASVVINGMTSETLKAIESRHVLGILNNINDIEVIWLCHFSHYVGTDEYDEFHDKHYEVLKPISRELGQSAEVYEAIALQDSYKEHLERLKLIKLTGKIYHATTLGRMVLSLAGL